MSASKSSEIAVTNRMNIPLFQPGKDGPSIFSSGDMNVLVRALRALTNPRIVWGQRDAATITDGNFLIQLSRDSVFEEGVSQVQQYILTDASPGDYFVCRTTAIISGGIMLIGDTDFAVAKPFHLRQSVFDRDVLNAAAPENIGTVDEITYDVDVESWDGVTFSTETKRFSFEYKSSTFRIATNATDEDPDNWTSQNQTIIPRFVSGVLTIPEGINITDTIAPTIIYTVKCQSTGVFDGDGAAVNLLALNDGWAWAKT